ncbi:MAG: phosphatase PAP2 family protein [Planctomycetaceae bacterium]|nr:phosphatase PAP2 family protein [Planctomycetaceae bacterium]
MQSNHIKQNISRISYFGFVLLGLFLFVIILVFFSPVLYASAIFSYADKFGSETVFGVCGAGNNIMSNSIDDENKRESDYLKNTLFKQLPICSIDFEPLPSGSDLSSFRLTSLTTKSVTQSDILNCSENYRYKNCNQPYTSSAAIPPITWRSKFYQRKCCIRDYFNRKFPLLRSDFRNFNSYDSLGNLFVAFSGAAILANTSLDVDFRNWFCQNISHPNSNNTGLNEFNAFAKGFGEMPMILFFTLSTAGYKFFPHFFPQLETKQSFLGEYVTMVSRSYIVGTPANLLGQLLVGSGRPSGGTSAWFKGNFNGVSGHAFVGAVPFITAAQMTDNLWLKFVFYTCSTFTGISRIYNDSHYLSQMLLGWYVAYLSVRAISKTEDRKLTRGLTIFPIIEKENTGLGVMIKF